MGEPKTPAPAWGTAEHATAMLVLLTVFWGLSFPLIKQWLGIAEGSPCPGGAGVASSTLSGLRAVLALGILLVFLPRLFRTPSWRSHLLGFGVGAVNGLGSVLQVWGMETVSPALSAFFTSLACAWVPVVLWVFFGTRVRQVTVLGFVLAVVGAGVLFRIDQPESWDLGRGEWMSLLCSVIFAFAIIWIDRAGRAVPSGHITVGFMAGTGIPPLLLAAAWTARTGEVTAWLDWSAGTFRDGTLLRNMILLVVLCTVLSNYWITIYQPRVPAVRAALIYLLEPLFTLVFSGLWGYDQLSGRLLVGGGLILGGNLLVELPGWVRRRMADAVPTPASPGNVVEPEVPEPQSNGGVS